MAETRTAPLLHRVCCTPGRAVRMLEVCIVTRLARGDQEGPGGRGGSYEQRDGRTRHALPAALAKRGCGLLKGPVPRLQLTVRREGAVVLGRRALPARVWLHTRC